MIFSCDKIIQLSEKRGYWQLKRFLEEKNENIFSDGIGHVRICDDNMQNISQSGGEYYFSMTAGENLNNLNENHIILFADKESMYRIFSQLNDILFSLREEYFNSIIDATITFNHMTLKSHKLDSMINYFNDRIENPIIIYDEFFNINQTNDADVIEYDRIDGTLEKKYLHKLFYYEQTIVFTSGRLKGESCTRLLFPVLSEDEIPKGYLAIFAIKTPIKEIDMLLLEIFANCILVGMKKTLNMRNIETKFISDFLYDLIYRKTDKQQEIERRAGLLNLSMTSDYCIIAINPIGKIENLRFDTNGYISQHEFMYDRIMSNIKNLHVKKYEQDIVAKFNDSTYILHRLSEKDNKKTTMENIKKICHTIKDWLEKHFSGMEFQIGIGDIVSGLENVSVSFEQAWATISFGEIVHGNKKGFIYAYSDNSILKLFGRLKEANALDEIIPYNLSKLYEYDLKTNSELYETLKVYLDSNCNAKKAADKMYIHYKTIMYRLDRIKNKFGIDIENANDRLYIELGIQLIDLKKGLI